MLWPVKVGAHSCGRASAGLITGSAASKLASVNSVVEHLLTNYVVKDSPGLSESGTETVRNHLKSVYRDSRV